MQNCVDCREYYRTGPKTFEKFKLLYVGSLLKHNNVGFIFDVVEELCKCTDKEVVFTRVGYNNKKQEIYQFDNIKYINIGEAESINEYYNWANVYLTPSFSVSDTTFVSVNWS